MWTTGSSAWLNPSSAFTGAPALFVLRENRMPRGAAKPCHQPISSVRQCHGFPKVRLGRTSQGRHSTSSCGRRMQTGGLRAKLVGGSLMYRPLACMCTRQRRYAVPLLARVWSFVGERGPAPDPRARRGYPKNACPHGAPRTTRWCNGTAYRRTVFGERRTALHRCSSCATRYNSPSVVRKFHPVSPKELHRCQSSELGAQTAARSSSRSLSSLS